MFIAGIICLVLAVICVLAAFGQELSGLPSLIFGLGFGIAGVSCFVFDKLNKIIELCSKKQADSSAKTQTSAKVAPLGNPVCPDCKNLLEKTADDKFLCQHCQTLFSKDDL